MSNEKAVSTEPDTRVWIDAINRELGNLRDWANQSIRRAEAAENMVGKLAKALHKWQQFSKDCIPSDAAGMDELTGYDRMTESLLSDPLVKEAVKEAAHD